MIGNYSRDKFGEDVEHIPGVWPFFSGLIRVSGLA
jgi:hypothetical protein